MPSLFAPLLTRTMSLDGPSEWPNPPFGSPEDWDFNEGPVRPCLIETLRGVEVEGEMLGFDAKKRSLIFRFDSAGAPLRVHFHRFRRVMLMTPLPTYGEVSRQSNAFSARLRKYQVSLTGADDASRLKGRTAGHVETAEGLFLFTPDSKDMVLHRVFVPSSAYTRCVLGPSIHEHAAQNWISKPQELLAALQQQGQHRVIPVGQALVNLGLLSSRQLLSFLEMQGGRERRTPIGEMLVMAGVISRADLRTALVHKMGYPLVDLARFPVEPHALEGLPMEALLDGNALPLMRNANQLIVAVDNLACTARLQEQAAAGLRVVPVLALKMHIEAALARLAHEGDADFWRYSAPTVWPATATALLDH